MTVLIDGMAQPKTDKRGINEYCAELPLRRHSHEAKGMLLAFPRTGLVMVPFEQVGGGWNCVVVAGNDTYPRDGYSLFVSRVEIETAVEMEIRPASRAADPVGPVVRFQDPGALIEMLSGRAVVAYGPDGPMRGVLRPLKPERQSEGVYMVSFHDPVTDEMSGATDIRNFTEATVP